MLYPYLADTISESEKIKLSKAFKIYGANFVTTEDGTGVVHTAVMYGQDDFELGTENRFAETSLGRTRREIFAGHRAIYGQICER